MLPRHGVGRPGLSVTAHDWLPRGAIETSIPAPYANSTGNGYDLPDYEDVIRLGGTSLMVTLLTWLIWIALKHIYHYIKDNFPDSDGECHKGRDSDDPETTRSKHHKKKARSERFGDASTACNDVECGCNYRK
jgi:hypothetical protein